MSIARFILVLVLSYTCALSSYAQEDKVYILGELAQDSIGALNHTPRFPGCEDLAISNKQKDRCGQKLLFNYIFSQLRYPEDARKYGTQGTVVVSFTIKKDGSLSNIKTVKELPDGCTEEVLRIMHDMNKKEIKWIPGKQDGQAVNTQYTLPVRFIWEGIAPPKKRPKTKKRKKSKN